MTGRVIIALTGIIGSGKTTAAMHLVNNRNYHRVRFAGPLKNMTYAFGLTWEHIEGSLKEEPCDLLDGKTPRQFMQLLGTEFGRNMIAPDIWIKAWQHAVEQVPKVFSIVADDCRFPNEADAVRRISSKARVVRIIRGGGDSPITHVSELQAFPVDGIIDNSGTIEELYKKIDRLANRVEGSHR